MAAQTEMEVVWAWGRRVTEGVWSLEARVVKLHRSICCTQIYSWVRLRFHLDFYGAPGLCYLQACVLWLVNRPDIVIPKIFRFLELARRWFV